MKISLRNNERFESRHNGPDQRQVSQMLEKVGANSLEELIEQTIPATIRLQKELDLPTAKSEFDFLKDIKKTAQKNKVFRSFIGMGYYNTITPGVIQRNILENPGWYTAYTPYQAEIAQGRLEALINFQTTVMDLTGMELANASLLDEGTAAAEAMSMSAALRKGAKKKAHKFFVDQNVFPQTLDILQTRALPIGIELVSGDLNSVDLSDSDLYGIMVQYPDGNGEVKDYQTLVEAAHQNDLKVTFIADLLSLALLTPPGEFGADIVVGTTQRFGVPMGYGGPHAGYFATKEQYRRQIPGRIIGVSKDKEGNTAYRMALQTREQHIKREKATSNICTAQVLLAVMAGMYSVYHGPNGIRRIAENTLGHARLLDKGLKVLGYKQVNENYFDTLKVEMPSEIVSEKIEKLALAQEINFRYFDNQFIGIAIDETTTIEDIQDVLGIFAEAIDQDLGDFDPQKEAENLAIDWPQALVRKSDYLTHPVFNTHHSESEMLRYIKQLENKDLSLVHSMISLGSCTMKLNATAEMIPITWPEFCNMHPFVPANQAEGYRELFTDLEKWLSEITGFAATSLQPNSGAQGELAGLLVIRALHHSRGEVNRNVVLIPSSAHGTNPASAVMAGMKVVIVKCDENGNIDVADLKEKAESHKEDLSTLIVTYPSTHGVFEESIKEICQIVHDNGGRVYMDGANMNAQVGLTSPATIGADVCHLNLHKTFCIPHGGGGPGVGPICVTEELKPFLPSNPVIATGGENGITAISAAPWGSADILTISYAYIAMMGADGLKRATQLAILNANYIQTLLKDHYPVLYKGSQGRNAHELIVDCRQFKAVGVEVEDIAKRLMDYGFHAPTVSFPVAGTLMIEPTESEATEELDRFCEAMIAIRNEIREIEEGIADKESNVLKNAPHTATTALSDNWNYPYSREKAVYPLAYVKQNKFWPSVSRVDSAYGDRNLFCSCVAIDAYEPEEPALAH
ncbi:aminomethyl-transferring glycine dehydrogenase [Xanthovirga aplysinae]|uniref:aminomethyl-transferring glycine dehydrogenase n=1 Tax=Xanthovirga aplysinae TaxID=2529853 RepID=UPI0012BC5ACC|nr:aminomethyl-transferring glycine dehydrogenase [Xanthovirga aplysinae]MTI30618.1 glycine dehydrogenase (aminomethyl-transferring) [Xanthovirga aplysinae]